MSLTKTENIGEGGLDRRDEKLKGHMGLLLDTLIARLTVDHIGK